MTDHDPRSVIRESEGTGSRTRTAFVAAVLVAVLGSAGVAWFAYNRGFYSASNELAPIVRADGGDTKRRPDQPGGLEVPHQDKLVFERLAPGQTGPRVERLLPPPEEPVARPAPAPEPVVVAESPPVEAPEPATPPAPPAQVAATIVEALVDREPEPAVPVAPPEPEVVAETAPPEPVRTESLLAEAPPTPAPAPSVAAAPAEEPGSEVAAVAPKPEPEIRPAAIPAEGAWRIQLASLSSSDGAEAEWQRIKGRHPELLGALGLNIQKAELTKGTFYRLQAGPLADKSAAQQLCASLKERKQDCLVVQR